MKKEVFVIPPHSDAILIGGIGGIISFVLVILKVEPYLTTTVDPWFLLLLSLVIILTNCRDFVLSSDELICRHFFITYRKLKWTEISDAVLFSEWDDLGHLRKEYALLITIKPCRPYDERLYSIHRYRLTMLSKSIFIRMSKEKVDALAQTLSMRLGDDRFRDMRKR